RGPAGVHAPVEPCRDPAPASREKLPADRELLLHARVRRVLPVPCYAREGTPMIDEIGIERWFAGLAAAALLAAPAYVSAQGRWETTVVRIEPGEWNGPRSEEHTSEL